MRIFHKFGILAASALLVCLTAVPAQEKGQKSSHTAFTHDLPALNGSHLSVDVVEVNYGPGAGSPPHSHPCPVIGYVVEGTLRTQVRGQAEAIYTAGQSFYEDPNGVHLVSANASDTKPAKLLAFFVCDHKAPLSTSVPGESR